MLIGWASFALCFVGLMLCAVRRSTPPPDCSLVADSVPRHREGAGQARFRGQRAAPVRQLVEPLSIDAEPLRRARFDELPQHRAYPPGSTTAVTDSVLLVYRDLR